MKTIIFNENNLEQAGKLIRDGGVVAFPTETVYGLGADAMNPEAVKKIFSAKGRPSDNPLIVHIADKKDISKIAREIPYEAEKIIDRFMPGPITVILKKQPGIPNEVTAGLDTVGIRFPSNITAQRFIKEAGAPIAAPSANLSGKPSPTSWKYVLEDMDGRIDGIIEGENCDVGVESTIVDCSSSPATILRPGGVTPEMLKEVIPDIKIDKGILKQLGKGEQPKCPGMKYKHYAPEADVTVIEGGRAFVQGEIDRLLSKAEGKTGVLTMFGDHKYNAGAVLHGGSTNEEYASNLFMRLREFDELGVDCVFAEFQEQDGYGLAVRNRLYKSAGGKVIKEN